jgi:hypothetical protein
MNDIKINELKISQIKYPLVFLFRVLSYVNELDDINLSIILRLFLKHHFEIGILYNLKMILGIDLQKKILSINVINSFYRILNKKRLLTYILKKWHAIYTNKKFWKLETLEQIEKLYQIQNHFMSIFDCSKGGIPYHLKVYNLLKTEQKHFIIENIKERLELILNIFGEKIFINLNIPLICSQDFDKLTPEEMTKYLQIIFQKFNEVLTQTIKIFESFNYHCLELNNLLNPVNIQINTSFLDSETECDDIKLFSK